MHLALDIGSDFTYIACWDESQSIHNASVKVRIPGLGTNFLSRDKWTWANYISHVFREYILPTRRVITSAILALPGILDLNFRRMLIGIMEEVMGLGEAEVIPRPLGLVVGWSQQLDQPLSGDLLLVEVQGSSLDFAFLSTFADGGIILENVAQGSWEDLVNAGRESGYCHQSGWSLDYILIAGDHCDLPDLADLIAGLGESTQMLHDPEPGWNTIDGLYLSRLARSGSSGFVIYPYDFYLKVNRPDNDIKIKLGFDTRNLELAIDGSYLLEKLDPSQYCFDDPTRRVRMQILEVPRHNSSNLVHLNSQPVVLDIDSYLHDLPGTLNLRLNLKSALLSLELPDETTSMTTTMPSPLPEQANVNLEQLYLNLDAGGNANNLHQAYQTFITTYPSESNLTDEIQFCLFHLYGLLQIYNQ